MRRISCTPTAAADCKTVAEIRLVHAKMVFGLKLDFRKTVNPSIVGNIRSKIKMSGCSVSSNSSASEPVVQICTSYWGRASASAVFVASDIVAISTFFTKSPACYFDNRSISQNAGARQHRKIEIFRGFLKAKFSLKFSL